MKKLKVLITALNACKKSTNYKHLVRGRQFTKTNESCSKKGKSIVCKKTLFSKTQNRLY